MARVSYAIRVKLLKRKESDNHALTLADDFRRIRIIPTYEENPPQMADEKDRDLALVRERTIRKGLLKGKLGKLVVSAEEPRPLHTSTSNHLGCPATTMIPISLTFHPEDPALDPPELYTLSTKLRVHTFFSTNPIYYLPTPSAVALDGALGRYHESILLGMQNLGGVKWVKHTTTPTTVYYTADIKIPLVTPKCKTLVPTFTSCQVARNYTLEVHIDVNTPGYNLGSHPGVTLKVPLQIANPPIPCASSSGSSINSSEAEEEGLEDEDEELPGFEEEFFTPRSIAPPEGVPVLSEVVLGSRPASMEFDHGVRVVPGQVAVQQRGAELRSVNSQLPGHMRRHSPNGPPPPGYSYFTGGLRGVPVRIPEPVGISPGCG